MGGVLSGMGFPGMNLPGMRPRLSRHGGFANTQTSGSFAGGASAGGGATDLVGPGEFDPSTLMALSGIQNSLGDTLAELGLKTRYAKEDRDLAVNEYRRSLPLRVADLRSQAAAQGSYESQARIAGETDLEYQTRIGIEAADREYQRTLEEAALAEQQARREARDRMYQMMLDQQPSGGGGGGGRRSSSGGSSGDGGRRSSSGGSSGDAYSGSSSSGSKGKSSKPKLMNLSDADALFKAGKLSHKEYQAALSAKGKTPMEIDLRTRKILGLGTEYVSAGRAKKLSEKMRSAIRSNKIKSNNPFNYQRELTHAANLRKKNPDMDASEYTRWVRGYLERKGATPSQAAEWMRANARHLSVTYNDAFKRGKTPRSAPRSSGPFHGAANNKAYAAYVSRMKHAGRKARLAKSWYAVTHKK